MGLEYGASYLKQNEAALAQLADGMSPAAFALAQAMAQDDVDEEIADEMAASRAAGRTPVRVLVIAEQPYFAEQAATHLVTMGADEAEREHRFFRDARKGQRARSMDGEWGMAGRYFFKDKVLLDRPYDADAGSRAGMPEVRHASFAAFLAAVGYDWRTNSYWPAAAAA